MSGPSRAEIVELRDQWRGWLNKYYPGHPPENVCRFYADLDGHLKSTSGAPDLRLRNMGRLLKGHLESDVRGPDRGKSHLLLLATHASLIRDRDLSAAKKEARREWNRALKDIRHPLHDLMPVFKDGVLQVSEDVTSTQSLGQLLREQLAEKPNSATA